MVAFGLPDYAQERAEYVLEHGRKPQGPRKKPRSLRRPKPSRRPPPLDDYELPTGILRKLAAVRILRSPNSPGAVYLSTRDLASSLAPERLEQALQDFDEDDYEVFDPAAIPNANKAAPRWWPYVSLPALYCEITEGEDYEPYDLIQHQRQHQRKGHCKYGHELSGSNLYISPGGKHYCKACDARHGKEYRERRRAKLVM